MAHNLATTNGKTAMMYTGEVPWHKLGTKLDQPATAREAIEAAGLNYRVDLKSLATEDGTSVLQRKAVFDPTPAAFWVPSVTATSQCKIIRHLGSWMLSLPKVGFGIIVARRESERDN